ncbi:putative kinetochore protein SPC25 [Leucoagaricus sp. SymC.cos]|nr:putative kinetochore protein SPC25 [Leucoagaricus sp. SymC.cos]
MNTARLPRIDLSLLLQDQHPHIDLRTNIYEESTRNFLKALVGFKNNAITSISDRRKYQAVEKKKFTEKSQQFEKEINQCKLKEIDLVAELEREKEERKEAELSVAALQRQLTSLKDKCAAIQGEIEQYRAITGNLRREKDKERATLSIHASRVSPELIGCETQLGCLVEGKDKLLFRFTSIDHEDSAREASFVLDITDACYKVITVSPNLPAISVLLSQLSDTGDIYSFIQEARRVFIDNFNTDT